jgi:hypothetical protein
MTPAVLELADGRRLAYSRVAGAGPGVVFLGGFRSDMTGTKAAFLEAWARERGRAFLRFDYTGHGASSGDFEAGCIGDWARDAGDALLRLPFSHFQIPLLELAAALRAERRRLDAEGFALGADWDAMAEGIEGFQRMLALADALPAGHRFWYFPSLNRDREADPA